MGAADPLRAVVKPSEAMEMRHHAGNCCVCMVTPTYTTAKVRGWPVQVITINGRQKSSKISPIAGTVQRVDT